MGIFVGLREMNQQFTEYVQMVEGGEEIVITRRGKPIARLVRFESASSLTLNQQAALERSKARMNKGFEYEEGTFDREDLYDR